MISVTSYEAKDLMPRVCVIGVGGAGGNAVANMIEAEVRGVEFVVANTDAQALNASQSARRIQLGRQGNRGLGAGSVAAIGGKAAQESVEDIVEAIDGAHMCFIAAGMGGGTGTGAAPVIARIAREMGILTVGVVTKPFGFEGTRRARVAEAGIEELQKHVDTLIVIPNQNLFRIANAATTFKDAFRMADDVLQQGVRGITDLIVMPGLVNLDFADIRSVMGGMGKAMMGTGESTGPNRAVEAAEAAISNPLLDGIIAGARGVIISITGGDDMGLMEVDEAANHIRELVDPEADIIWGSAIDPGLAGRMRISIVATGLGPVAKAPLPVRVADLVPAPVAIEPAIASIAPAPPLQAELVLCTENVIILTPPEEVEPAPAIAIPPPIIRLPDRIRAPRGASLLQRVAGLSPRFGEAAAGR